jgi:hypothetical protein
MKMDVHPVQVLTRIAQKIGPGPPGQLRTRLVEDPQARRGLGRLVGRGCYTIRARSRELA